MHLAREQPSVLWSGSAATVARIVPGCAIYFGLLTSAKASILARRAEDGDAGAGAGAGPGAQTLTAAEARTPAPVQTPPPLVLIAPQSLAVGAICRGVADVAVSPLTVIKARLESARGREQYSGVLHAFRCMRQAESPRALYAGLGATLLRDAPYAGVYYYLYELFKASLADVDLAGASAASDSARNFSAACGAGALSTLITHPPDVVKTRLQLQRYGEIEAPGRPAGAVARSAPPGYTGFAQCAYVMLRDEGAASLLRGFLPRLVKRTLSSAVTWTLYEHILKSM
eukprot:tig00000194_g14810.t1